RDIARELAGKELQLGVNAPVFYETREDWQAHNPNTLNWRPATSRLNPLGGEYVARVPATTGENGDKISFAFNTTQNKGAGIRVYEYANSPTIVHTRMQLESLFWLCGDSIRVVQGYGMEERAANERKDAVIDAAGRDDLLDKDRLVAARIVNQ